MVLFFFVDYKDKHWVGGVKMHSNFFSIHGIQDSYTLNAAWASYLPPPRAIFRGVGVGRPPFLGTKKILTSLIVLEID